ncbi:putative fbd-associated f-box protein, partial [Quercus suber]
HVRTWVDYAIEHGVQQLHLLVKRNITCELPQSHSLFNFDLLVKRNSTCELPRSLFSCGSLEVLELSGKIVLDCPPSVHLPNLKHLYLKKIKYANDDSFHRLLIGSPNLLRLHVLNRPYNNVNFILNNPTLEYLDIDNQVQDARFCEVQINAPSLKFLILNIPNCHDFSVRKATNVVEANVNLFELYQLNVDDCIVKLLKALPNVRNLALSYNKSLSFASANDLPIYNNLSRLQLEVKCCNSHLLPILLENSPNLENLILKSCWTESVNVPKCLKSHLRTISLRQFKGLEHELKLITYMLKNAKVLQRMDILSGSSSYKKKFRILNKLFELPRASSTDTHIISLPLPVKKFRLALDSFDDSIHFHVSSWICYAVDHGVEELELLLLFRKPFELPRRFFGCKSLKIVTLYGDIVLNCPSFVHLPNLKDLRLGSKLCSNEDSFHSLLTGIPNLITFFIGRVRRDDVTTINICHPRLLFFCIQNKVPFPFKIEIDAPSLKCLSFFDGSGQDSLTTNIVKATFDLSEHKQQADEHDSRGHLLTELPRVQSLLVRHTKVQSLRFGFSLPMLNILRALQFDVKCCKWHILPRLLESAPNLEKLSLHKVDTDGPHELCCWTEPPHVPKCLESCLRIIYLVKFKSWEHDLEFVQFFLKNAKVLEKMGILTGLLDLAENSRILKKFSVLPRGSSNEN